ncbi:MAG: alpha-1,2-fucosyltransferase [Lachnospiraceae bacterium]|nr:alpha-1,2-fucosyltransferase [Lachnospiraceae bacterium]
MLVVKIKGGLGNQMFEYAVARKLQMTYQLDKIGLDLSIIGNDSIRDYGLDCFQLSDNVEIIENRNKIVRMQEMLAKKLVSYFVAGIHEATAKKREDILASVFALFGIIQRDHSCFKEKRFLKFHNNLYMNGWFQEANMLVPIREQLLKDFTWKTDRECNEDIYQQIIHSNAVCVHIRRGDYVNNPIFDVCKDSYYYNAMKYMTSIVQNPIFYVFSDSISQVEDEMEFPYPVVYVREQHEDYEDLYLMKHCRHFIMSNSTFSWWAQFLGEAEDKVVVAPAKWCLDADMDVGVYMKEWILLEEE